MKSYPFATTVASLTLALALAGQSLSAGAADGTEPIRHVLMSTFDKPEARLAVGPIVVVGEHAVAGWTQGERGGRALLRRHGGQWQITLCAGDALKDAAVLREAGIPRSDAETLARVLAAAEARIPAVQRTRFATFDGVVHMDASGQHPPAHKH